MDIHNASKREKKAAELEAKLLSSLHHPNIVGYKDSFQGLDGFLYIAMSFCEGRGRIRVKVASTFANELFRYRINFSIRILLRLSVKSFARIKIITFDGGENKQSPLDCIAFHSVSYSIPARWRPLWQVEEPEWTVAGRETTSRVVCSTVS